MSIQSSTITTHVLNTARGVPASGVGVRLQFQAEGGWTTLATGSTDSDGRLRDLLPETAVLAPGTYRLTFDTGAYFAALGEAAFYPSVEITFAVQDSAQHYHVPLLLSPFGYSTYRGS